MRGSIKYLEVSRVFLETVSCRLHTVGDCVLSLEETITTGKLDSINRCILSYNRTSDPYELQKKTYNTITQLTRKVLAKMQIRCIFFFFMEDDMSRCRDVTNVAISHFPNLKLTAHL